MKKLLFIILLLGIAHGVQAADKIDNFENEIRIVLKQVSPSLVKVVAENSRKYVATGIALENGLVITSSLVTRHPFERISVETIRGEKITARIAGQDSYSGLALLRIGKSGPPPLPQGKPAEVGGWVALVGLFYDRFPSIFQGIISSLSENELILNAPVAPGSAGGAVVNKKGELLGIIRGSVGFSFTPDYTFKDHSATIMVSGSKSENSNLCFAIPIERVRRIAEKLKTGGRIIPGWMGINFSSDSNLVHQVVKGAPAAKAGIVKGDRIEEIAGKPIASFRDIVAALEFRQAGETVGVTIGRAGKRLSLEVKLGERRGDEPLLSIEPPLAPEIPEGDLPLLADQLSEMLELPDLGTALPRVRNYVIEFSGARQLGVDVMEITAELGRKFGVQEGYGLLVSRVYEESAARKAGLEAGDVIVRAKDSPIRTTADLRNVLNTLKEKEAVLLELYRDNRARKFSLVPDKKEGKAWDVRQFARKIEDLKDHISNEAQWVYEDEIKKMRQSREKAQLEMQKQKRQYLLKAKEESRRLEAELKKLEEEKGKLASEARDKYSNELKRIREEIRSIQERIRRETEGKGDEGGSGR